MLCLATLIPGAASGLFCPAGKNKKIPSSLNPAASTPNTSHYYFKVGRSLKISLQHHRQLVPYPSIRWKMRRSKMADGPASLSLCTIHHFSPSAFNIDRQEGGMKTEANGPEKSM
jgi:hypothetical protein